MNAIETLKINLAEHGNLFQVDSLDKLSDQELLSMDFILYRVWEFKRKGHGVFLDGEDWDFEDMVASHAHVRQEMNKRALRHLIQDELDDQTQPLIREATEKQEGRTGTIVQTIILDKKVFSTEAEAKHWAEDHGFRTDKVDETENSFRFRQSDPDDFDPDGFGQGERFRTIHLTDGVQAVIGFLNEKSADAVGEGVEDLDVAFFNPFHDDQGRFSSGSGGGSGGSAHGGAKGGEVSELRIESGKISGKPRINPREIASIVKKQTSVIPKTYLQGIKKVEASDTEIEVFRELGMKREAERMKNRVLGTYNKKTREIWMNPFASAKGHLVAKTVTHEVGHHVWNRFLSPSQQNAWIGVSRAKERRVTRYARTSPQEHFSESFAFYYSGRSTRQFLAATNPSASKFFEKHGKPFIKFLVDTEISKSEFTLPEELEILVVDETLPGRPDAIETIAQNAADFIDEFIADLAWRGEAMIETSEEFERLKSELSKQLKKALGAISEESANSSDRSSIIFEDKTADDVDKGVRQAFGSYGGKRFLAHRIASYIPHHRTYVEPFAGGAAVLYAKDPSPQEVLNDRDPEIAFMHRFIRNHSAEDRAALARRDWVIRKETHERLKEMKPDSDRDRFYKSFYLTRSSYGKQRGGSFNPANAGVRIDFPANIERAQARLKNVAVSNKDYREILKEHDSPETFFYMDPPYPGKFNLFDFGFKEEEFLKAVKGLKAHWIISYPVENAEVFKGFNVYRVKRRNQMKGPGGNQEWVTELLVSNFPLKPLHLYIEKELDPTPEGLEAEAPELLPQIEQEPELEKVQAAFKSPGGKYRLYKKIIALIPEHKTFVEGFCGGAQVFFHKKRSETEVINDVNSDLIFSYRFIKNMAPEDWEWLKKQNWVISRGRARKVFEIKPRNPRERFYRFAYLNKSTYWGRTDVWEGVRTGPKGDGYHIKLVGRLPEIKERLQGVRLHSLDWKEAIKQYDSKDTFFYLDPPYPLHWPKEGGGHGSKFFKEEEMLPVLKNIKGKFVLSYELEKVSIFKGFKTYRVKTLWTGMHQLGVRSKYELLVSNFPLKPNDLYVEKSLESIRVLTSGATVAL
ncbi:MAG: DNA adenine methylase [Elusimicrobia bacterium]|nr:DNA adenine methylase [Elusimicrobiota bacterium]